MFSKNPNFEFWKRRFFIFCTNRCHFRKLFDSDGANYFENNKKSIYKVFLLNYFTESIQKSTTLLIKTFENIENSVFS